MPDYQWAINKGEIIISDYDRSMALDKQQVESEILGAFSNLFEGVTVSQISDEYKEVYKVVIPRENTNEIISIKAREVTIKLLEKTDKNWCIDGEKYDYLGDEYNIKIQDKMEILTPKIKTKKLFKPNKTLNYNQKT